MVGVEVVMVGPFSDEEQSSVTATEAAVVDKKEKLKMSQRDSMTLWHCMQLQLFDRKENPNYSSSLSLMKQQQQSCCCLELQEAGSADACCGGGGS